MLSVELDGNLNVPNACTTVPVCKVIGIQRRAQKFELVQTVKDL